MSTTIEVGEAAGRLRELLTRTSETGERFVIEENGRPLAELGPVAEPRVNGAAPPDPDLSSDDMAVREQAFLRKMEAEGVIAPRQPGPQGIPFQEWRPIEYHGPPVSEAILEDRDRTPEDDLLAREAACRRAMEAEGMIVPRERCPSIPLSERPPIEIKGPPLSHTIIEDRD
jgi:antitoxin (DNA-binding transcriptional repressor) of toxin-antitoxin stability system